MVVTQADRQVTTSAFLDHLHGPQRPVLVFDGATGTSLQGLGLTADDFGGPDLEGCNENLAVTKPDAVKAVHRQFLEVGCDVIETDTFGAASIVLAEYGLEDKAFELNKRAAELAREMADEFSTPEKPRFVAGSMGPTTKRGFTGVLNSSTISLASSAARLFSSKALSSRPYSASTIDAAPKVSVSMTSQPTSRNWRCTALTASGLVTARFSLQPSRSGPPKSSAVSPSP